MRHAFIDWARRNTRRAVALALAPGLAMLAIDAAIGHFAGKVDFDNWLQFIPVVYGALAFASLPIAVWPATDGPFAWCARLLGAAGVVVGLTGTILHLDALLEELKGEYSWSSVEGGLSVAPPVFAPLAFAGVGLLLWLLPSTRLVLRVRGGLRRSSSAPRLPSEREQQAEKRAG